MDSDFRITHTREWARSCLEPYQPGGWWRHDIKMRALELLWPEWITATQFFEFLVILDPRWGRGRIPWINAGRGLSRFHKYGYVDRIGERGGLRGRIPGGNTGAGYLVARGYRYRLIRREEDLL